MCGCARVCVCGKYACGQSIPCSVHTHHNPSLNAQLGVLVEPDLHTRLVLQESEDQILVEGGEEEGERRGEEGGLSASDKAHAQAPRARALRGAGPAAGGACALCAACSVRCGELTMGWVIIFWTLVDMMAGRSQQRRR